MIICVENLLVVLLTRLDFLSMLFILMILSNSVILLFQYIFHSHLTDTQTIIIITIILVLIIYCFIISEHLCFMPLSVTVIEIEIGIGIWIGIGIGIVIYFIGVCQLIFCLQSIDHLVHLAMPTIALFFVCPMSCRLKWGIR